MKTTLFILLSFLVTALLSQKRDVVLYKQIDTTRLYIEVVYPSAKIANENNAAVVFFFGGGWINGSRASFEHHAVYFSQRGLTCFLVDYRTKSKNGTTPFESLKDAKSAMRFIKKNAERFHIDTSKIIAAGGSAGGHLAAATALITKYNEEGDDLSVSTKPCALFLFNPVIDNGPGGYGFDRIGPEYKDFSPLHNIQKGAPPTIILIGDQDQLVPVETVRYYKIVMEKAGSRCDLKLYEGQKHAFYHFNAEKQNIYYNKTVYDADKFLSSLGYLSGEPAIELK